MDGNDRTYRALRSIQRFVIEPPVRLVWRLGLAPPGDAQLETTGRHTGERHVARVCNGLVGDTVWVIAQHGRRNDFVQNIEADPRVRFRTGPRHRWRTGVAHVLDGDDPVERRRTLGRDDVWRRLCLSASHAMSTDPLTIRIDLDSPDAATDEGAQPAR